MYIYTHVYTYINNHNNGNDNNNGNASNSIVLVVNIIICVAPRPKVTSVLTRLDNRDSDSHFLFSGVGTALIWVTGSSGKAPYREMRRVCGSGEAAVWSFGQSKPAACILGLTGANMRLSLISGRSKKSNRTGRTETEPNRFLPVICRFP